MIDFDKRIFILNGVASTGKDTFVKYINECGVDAVHYSYVDFTRSILDQAGFPVNNKTDEMRTLLCEVNDSLEKFNDYPFIDCCNIAKDFYNNFLEGEWLFIDCREPEKIERLKRATKAKTVFIVSDKPVTASNKADKSVMNGYAYDYYINNTGTLEEFKNNTKKFIYSILSNEYISIINGNVNGDKL